MIVNILFLRPREPFGWDWVENTQKWVSACVSWNKKCFWCVWDTPWMFLNSLDHSKHATNLFCDDTTHNVEDFANFAETSSQKSAKIHWFYSKSASESHLGSINSQKWLSAHVWGNKNWLGCRTATLFLSADRYDPKEAFKHKHCGSIAFQKFSGALQLNSSWSSTSSFWVSREPFG